MNYLRAMADDGRLVSVSGYGFLLFSICNDYKPYEEKGMWTWIPHDPDGRICFIEKAVFNKWTLSLRKKITKEICKRFPNVEEAVWFRPTKNNDRKVTYEVKREASLRD